METSCFQTIVAFLLYVISCEVSSQITRPIVDTQYGQILGNRKLYEGETYLAGHMCLFGFLPSVLVQIINIFYHRTVSRLYMYIQIWF